ncbi:hypothetical protein PS862_01658 [Pseudomonas fluorescens]|uniref:diguanylate cyclase n=1 Tax=Pseudomonas fluorescens TaxID=294 RepID=A0A5E7IN77_PSEFL|nr:GGDEF domain-containing protein [Pseudomonas fluorescens]VVO77700.1 hypothetical protein PS862_01658 [Pseudomonas fluorescens]
MSDETQRWKEKYLKNIEQQEKLERQWDARLDLLRRGLVRSTLAAEGTDRAVDQCMKEMREVIRTNDMDAGLAALLPRLEKAVLDSEQRRETRVNQTSAALTALVAQLQTLPLPREVRRPLKDFAKRLDTRVSQAREIPLLLSELSSLQGKALSQLESPAEPGRPGLLQRLFGHREADDAAPLVALTEQAPTVQHAEAVSAPIAGEVQHDMLYALPDSPEPSYSSVARHIEDTLLGLFDDLTLPERHRPQAESMRERLKNGFNWYELLPILDDLATLMLAISDSGQHEFEAYLQRLNERLESFQSSLQAASAGHADSRFAAQAMHTQIREQVDGLQSSLHEAADLGDLKFVLENHLEGLLDTMEQHRKQRDEREQEMAGRLHSLAERVAHMEQEALGVREHLEEQRQKALIDPLTGLPNRAAWSERLDHEISQWQQQGNTLLLAMLDLDHFKRINDNYGHLAGDKVLKIIAGVLRKRLRGTDFIARFGGEEFVLLMPATVAGVGAKLLENLRTAIEACPFHFKGEPVTITLSIGLTEFNAGEHSDLVLKRADQALYRAKHAGRNRVQIG